MSAADLIDALSISPRAAGSAEEERARDMCESLLRSHGFETRREQFEYSAFAGALATPIAGGVLLLMFATVALLSRAEGRGAWVLIVAAAHIIALLLLAARARGPAILRDTFMRRVGCNLIARTGDVEPRLWLMAHLDSKSQPISILLRSLGATVVALAGSALLLLLLLEAAALAEPQRAILFCCGAGVAGSVPLLLSIVGNNSRGALDNASGVAAVIVAAASLRKAGVAEFGVVITSAEELGLAGAHAFAAMHPRSAALNCDSIDAQGIFLCLTGQSSGGKLYSALRGAASASETDLRERRRLMGILVDSVALGARGWDAVTLCRGNRSTLSRIHTRADVPKPGMGDSAEATASLIATAARKFLHAS